MVNRRRRASSWIGACLVMAALGISEYALAGCDANLTGVSDGVLAYTRRLLLIPLVSQRLFHPARNATASSDAKAIDWVLVKLMTSYAE